MDRILNELNRVPGIKGSLIVGTDGIVIASELSDELDEEEISALASALILASDKISQKVEQGQLKSIFVETSKMRWSINRARMGFLICLSHADSNLGLIRVELRDAVMKLNNLTLEV